MLDFAIFAVVLVVTLIVAVVYLYGGSKKVTNIPGPEVMDDLEGNLPDIKSCGSLHEFLLDIHDIYGPIASFFFGPQLCVSISSPELFKEQSKVFDRPAILFQLFEPLIGQSCIQYANGAEGRKRHSAYARCFSDSANRQYFPIIQQNTDIYAKELALLPKGQHVALRPAMFRFATVTMLQCSFGDFFEKKESIVGIQKSYDHTWEYLEAQLTMGTELITSQEEELFEKHKDKLYEIMAKVVRERENNPPKEGEKLFVDVLMELGLSEQTILSDALVLLIASFHTTGLLLTWCLYYLAENKEIQEEVYKELKAVLGDEPVTPDNMGELKYLRQVLDETLRCATLAPFAARVQDFDIELGGFRVPAGTPVVHALGVRSQDEVLFPDPEIFDPDRFSPENTKELPSHAFEPFGFGQRKCMGYKFSYTEATAFLCTVLRKFVFDMVPGQEVTKVYGLVTKPKEEIWMTVSKRD